MMAAQATVADWETQVTAQDEERDIMTADFEATCEALSRAQAHVEELTSRILSRVGKNARLREERDALEGARETREKIAEAIGDVKKSKQRIIDRMTGEMRELKMDEKSVEIEKRRVWEMKRELLRKQRKQLEKRRMDDEMELSRLDEELMKMS